MLPQCLIFPPFCSPQHHADPQSENELSRTHTIPTAITLTSNSQNSQLHSHFPIQSQQSETPYKGLSICPLPLHYSPPLLLSLHSRALFAQHIHCKKQQAASDSQDASQEDQRCRRRRRRKSSFLRNSILTMLTFSFRSSLGKVQTTPKYVHSLLPHPQCLEYAY